MIIGYNRAIKELKKERSAIYDRMQVAIEEVSKPFRKELDEVYKSIAALERERKLSKQIK